MPLPRLLPLLALFTVLASNPGQTQAAVALDKIKLPPGFSIGIFADGLPKVRSLALGKEGVVFAGSLGGAVYALQDADGDGRAEQRYRLASGLDTPNGVAFHNGTLFVAEVGRIIRLDNIMRHLAHPPSPVTVYGQLPTERWHGFRMLRVGPDGKLYLGIGAPCNICIPTNPVYGSLVRLNTDGSGFEVIAEGVRNSVGFDWLPGSEELYFTDNGRDELGDTVPPEELNLWTRRGSHYGYPYCHGGDIADPEFGDARACTEFIAPVWKFGAHMAALGVRFYQGQQFPDSYHKQLFVAEHGSWNRSEPQGYRLVTVFFEDGRPLREQVFAEGWLQADGKVLGRPVDVLTAADGSLLVSDDHAGVIYRISYQPGAAK